MSRLANIISILSLVSGFGSIILSLENHFTFASWAILISVILDGLDGWAAKKNPESNEFGKQLDSLVDAIAFGIAPMILGYIFVYRTFHLWAAIGLFAYLLSSVMRLARYNLTPGEDLVNCFYGLPITAAGGTLASFILIYKRYTNLPPPAIFLALVLVLSALMVSRIRYPNLNGLERIFRNSPLIASASVALILIFAMAGFYFWTKVFLPELSVFTLFLVYLIFSPFLMRKFVYNI